MSQAFTPAQFQRPLPLDKTILAEKPDEESVPMDVLFVGAGPAGLAGAVHLARLVKADNENGGGIGEVEIGVLEKAGSLGEHNLSGAVVNPEPLRRLFPEIDPKDLPLRQKVTKEAVYVLTENRSFKIPTPPTMRNHGNYVASICEIVRWLGEKAEGLGVNVFTGFPAESLLVEGEQVVGVRTCAAGLDRESQPGSGYSPPTDLTARITALSEGTRGLLAQSYLQWRKIASPNPQIFALGVKELWETKVPLEGIIHSMGWPLPSDAFGGSFLYAMEPNLLSLGLVVGLDAKQSTSVDVHVLLQRMKKHPLFRKYLDGGELVEWGAKTIPEGGFHSLPEQLSGDGCLLMGDCAGFVDVATLKGIHYAIESGILAAESIFQALKAEDCSAKQLSSYDRAIRSSAIASDLHRNRNMRLAFKSGFVMGGVKSGLMSLTGGRFPGGKISVEEDAAVARKSGEALSFTPDNELTYSKVDAVFKSGNETRDTIPSHLLVGDDVPADVADFYEKLCPAGVYEANGGKLQVNPPNCVDCKATDVVGPRWTPREGGSGPKYRRM